MHPAPSVIVFTSLSGLGFGILAWLGLGIPDVAGRAAFAMYFLGYGLAVGGLIASTLHLGKPANARKAFSQWRTSWLSREAVIAVMALLVVAPFAIQRIFLTGEPPLWLGFAGSVLCLATVFATSMIYAQLRTVPRWNHPLTPVLFLGYSVAGGAVLSGQPGTGAVLLVFVGAVQIMAWSIGDKRFAASGSTLGTATGLGKTGVPRQLESPHSGTNYLLDEMGYRVGRKHASKLRAIGALLGFALPVLIVIATPPVPVWFALAGLVHLAGVFAIRWLFFAEAEHVVSLYYGRTAA